MILIKLNVKNKSTLDLKKKLKKFGAEILLDNGYEFIIQFAGSPEEITKLEKLLKTLRLLNKHDLGLFLWQLEQIILKNKEGLK